MQPAPLISPLQTRCKGRVRTNGTRGCGRSTRSTTSTRSTCSALQHLAGWVLAPPLQTCTQRRLRHASPPPPLARLYCGRICSVAAAGAVRRHASKRPPRRPRELDACTGTAIRPRASPRPTPPSFYLYCLRLRSRRLSLAVLKNIDKCKLTQGCSIPFDPASGTDYPRCGLGP